MTHKTDAPTAGTTQREYQRGKTQKERMNLYEEVKLCETFYEGNQWDGLKTNSIKPVTMNFLRRVVAYFQSMIVSDDIGYSVNPFLPQEDSETVSSVLKASLDRIVERCKLKTLSRESLRDASVDGDSVLYFYFDPKVRTPYREGVQGEIQAELLMNTNIIFGNAASGCMDAQPYIILVRRLPLQQVRERAKHDGIKDWESIQAESESEYKGETEEHADETLCTELTRFWMQETQDGDAHVWFMKTCGKVVLQEATDTGLTRYPIAYWSWQPKKNACHGVRIMKENINSQIAVNRMWTAVMLHIDTMAFPKMVYDRNKFPKGWDATPGKAVGVSGDVKDSVTSVAGGVPLPTIVLDVIKLTIDTTRDCMGASDAALGNVKPDNTSAILAVQKASSAPLELQRLAFYQFTEDYVRILIDMMHAYYGIRPVKIKTEIQDPVTGQTSETEQIVTFDFGSIDPMNLDLNVEVGASTYWSELTQITNLNNLLSAGIITDAVDFLERAPKGLVPDMDGLLRKLREQRDAAAQAQTVQVNGAVLDPGQVNAPGLI